MSAVWDELHDRAKRESINTDISDFGDEWCEGFLAGQWNVLVEIAEGRLALPSPRAGTSEEWQTR